MTIDYSNSLKSVEGSPSVEDFSWTTSKSKSPPERGGTPHPDDTNEDNDGWVNRDDDQMSIQSSSFLTRGTCSAASGKHIRVSMTIDNRNTFTTIPVQFDNALNPSSVLLYFTNTRGQWKREYKLLDQVKPSGPDRKGQHALVLDSTHVGRIYQAFKVSRKNRTATFRVDGREWVEQSDNLCVVEDHKLSGCECKK